jgi:hypothetical protein
VPGWSLGSVSSRQKGRVCTPVSASEISVPAHGGDWFDDWVVVSSSSPITSTTHTLRLQHLLDTRDSAAISKTCLPNSRIRAVSALIFTANEPISAPGLCIENFRSRLECQRRVRRLDGELAVRSLLSSPSSLRTANLMSDLQIGRFCRDFRPLNSQIFVSVSFRAFSDEFWRPVSAFKNSVPGGRT